MLKALGSSRPGYGSPNKLVRTRASITILRVGLLVSSCSGLSLIPSADCLHWGRLQEGLNMKKPYNKPALVKQQKLASISAASSKPI